MAVAGVAVIVVEQPQPQRSSAFGGRSISLVNQRCDPAVSPSTHDSLPNLSSPTSARSTDILTRRYVSHLALLELTIGHHKSPAFVHCIARHGPRSSRINASRAILLIRNNPAPLSFWILRV